MPLVAMSLGRVPSHGAGVPEGVRPVGGFPEVARVYARRVVALVVVQLVGEVAHEGVECDSMRETHLSLDMEEPIPKLPLGRRPLPASGVRVDGNLCPEALRQERASKPLCSHGLCPLLRCSGEPRVRRHRLCDAATRWTLIPVPAS